MAKNTKNMLKGIGTGIASGVVAAVVSTVVMRAADQNNKGISKLLGKAEDMLGGLQQMLS